MGIYLLSELKIKKGGVSFREGLTRLWDIRQDQMESPNSLYGDPQTTVEDASPTSSENSEQRFSERFESLLPRIQERWPYVAKQTLEATRGSLDEVVKVIQQSSNPESGYRVREQLEELLNLASDRTKDFADSLEPLEKQLEDLLDDLNKTLRPRLEKPVRNRPLLALGIAAGVGLMIGLFLSGGRRN